jgi:hypothetical protein
MNRKQLIQERNEARIDTQLREFASRLMFEDRLHVSPDHPDYELEMERGAPEYRYRTIAQVYEQ